MNLINRLTTSLKCLIIITLIFHLCKTDFNTNDVKNKNNLFIEYQKHLVELNMKNQTKMNLLISDKKAITLNDSLEAIEKGFVDLSKIKSNIYLNLSPIENKLKRTAFELLYSLNLTNDCLSALFQWIEGLKRTELWAYQFFDATAKIPTGLTQGVISSFGEYDQCLGISSQTTDNQNTEQIIYGKYCLVKPIIPINYIENLDNFKGFEFINHETNQWIRREFKENVNKIKLFLASNQMTDKFYAFHYGICIPSQCQPKDIENVLKSVIPMISIEVGPKCDTINDRIQWNLFNILVVAIPILVSISTIISTLYSCKYQNPSQQKNIYFHEIMKSFSLIESNKRLFSPLKGRNLIVDFLFLLFALWHNSSMAYAIVIAWGTVGYTNTSFIVHVLTDSKYFWLRTTYLRDSIFFLSGIILSYKLLAKSIKMSFLSYLKFALEKWYRYFPKMLGSILISEILSIMGNGPIFSIESSQHVCHERVWKNILFIPQFVDKVFDMCVPMTWTYAVELQLHIICPLFLVPFTKSLKFGLIFNTIAIIVFSFVKTIPKIFFGRDIIPFEVSKSASIKLLRQSAVRYLLFTDQYISLFIFGVIIGYLLRKRPNLMSKLTKNRVSYILCSIICYSSTVLSVVWSENFKNINESKNQVNLISWFVLGNFLWVIGIVWTIIRFQNTVQGILYRVMSSRIFCALTRMGMAIVVNFGIIDGMLAAMKRHNQDTSHVNQMKTIYINSGLTLIASYLTYVLLEYPFIRLFEIFKNGKNVIHYKDVRVNDNNNNRENEQETIFSQ